MLRVLVASLLAVTLTVVGMPASAKAVAIRPFPLPERVALADAAVVGQVTTIQDKPVSAVPFAGAEEKVEYTIAVIKVEDGLFGVKGLTHVKVGFQTPPAGGVGGPIRRPGGFRMPRLTAGEEGCFLLAKHPTEPFFTLQGMDRVINQKDNPNYKKELATVKHCAKLLSDPTAGLKAKNADDRFLTAAMLVARYTAFLQPVGAKREPIDAGQSKLILHALAEADWSKPFSPTEPTAQAVFGRLGLGPADGWNPTPQTFQKPNGFAEAARKWLKDNADTYRIKRVVPDTQGK
jgi:hypothetical protein